MSHLGSKLIIVENESIIMLGNNLGGGEWKVCLRMLDVLGRKDAKKIIKVFFLVFRRI